MALQLPAGLEFRLGWVPFLHLAASERTLLSTAVAVGTTMLLILPIDLLLAAFVRGNLGARWFALHALVNLAITICVLPDLIETLKDPIHSMVLEKQYSMLPAFTSAALHLYHTTLPWYSASLTFQDYVHHFAFAFALGGMQLAYHWGPGSNYFMLWVTGLPGAMDYAMLAGVKLGVVTRLYEKKQNASINAWIRGPGCVSSSALESAGVFVF